MRPAGAYVEELLIAQRLGVPARDLPNEPLGLVNAARVALLAEAMAAQRKG